MTMADSFPSSPHSLVSSESQTSTLYHDCVSSPSLHKLASKASRPGTPTPPVPPIPAIYEAAEEAEYRNPLGANPPVVFSFPMLDKAPVAIYNSTAAIAEQEERLRDSILIPKEAPLDIEAGFNEKPQLVWRDANPSTPSRLRAVGAFFHRLFAAIRLAFLYLFAAIRAPAKSARAAIEARLEAGLAKPKHIHSSRAGSPMSVPELVISAVEGVEIVTSQAPLVGNSDLAIEYQICVRTAGLQQTGPITDIVFIQPTHLCSTQLPELAIPFIADGHRVLIPNFATLPRVQHGITIEQMVLGVGSVLRDVAARDAFDNDLGHGLGQGQPIYGKSHSRTRTTSSGQRVSLSSAPVLRQRSTFLLGTGLGGLVAAHYALSNHAYTYFNNANNRSSAISNLSKSVQSKVTGSGARSVPLAHRMQASVGLSPYPSVQGCILISPFIEQARTAFPVSVSVRSLRKSTSTPFRMVAPSKDALRAMRTLRDNAASIRTPILIMHGRKDCFSSATAVSAFYEGIGSHDKSLSVYPTLGNLHMLDALTRDDIACEALEWISDRLASEETAGQPRKRASVACSDYDGSSVKSRAPSIVIESLEDLQSSTFAQELGEYTQETLA